MGYPMAPKRTGDDYLVRLNDMLTCNFRGVHRDRYGWTADCLTFQESNGRHHTADVVLSSTSSRETYLKSLRRYEVMSDLAEEYAFVVACQAVKDAVLAGEPVIPFEARAPDPVADWFVEDLIPRNEVTILYGDGGAGKSFTLLAIAASALTGRPLAPGSAWKVARAASVLYLDYEQDQRKQFTRWWGLITPTGLPAPAGLHYRKMRRPFAEDLSVIRGWVDRLQVEAILCDSYLPAAGISGFEAESSDAASRTFTAMQSLSCTVLCSAHLSKAAVQASGPAPAPYGSVFVRNLARSCIMVSRDEVASGRDRLVVTFNHTKSNFGPLQLPSALIYAFGEKGSPQEGYVLVGRHDPDLSRAPTRLRIDAALKEGAKASRTLADELVLPLETVERALRRMRETGQVVRTKADNSGDNRKYLWGKAYKGGQ